MGQFNQLIRNRIIVSSIIATLVVIVAVVILAVASLSGRPQPLFRFAAVTTPALPPEADIVGSAGFDKNSYLLGELATYRVNLQWREAAVTPDLNAFRNGIGFFPFSRRELQESRRSSGNGINEYALEIELQAVDVVPGSRYELAPPTVYYTLNGSADRELQSYRLEPPVVHVGGYYPVDVSKIEILGYKGPIVEPRLLRQTLMLTNGMLLLMVAALMLWHFGRVRRPDSLDAPERLWLLYRSLDRGLMSRREYMDQCERVFTGLLRFRLHISPVLFWSGGNADSVEWREILQQARELFYRNYLPQEPDEDTLAQMSRILDDMFARLTEEERLRREQQPTLIKRVSSQYGALTTAMVIIVAAVLVLGLALSPALWLSRDVAAYNNAAELLHSDSPAQEIYEQYSKLSEQLTDPRIKAAALYNFAVLATRAELAGINQDQQHALLAVMFQEQKIFLDALLHSLAIEDPFLLVSILRDSVRFLTVSESTLKAATRIDANDERIRRNLELVMKRRNAYAQSIEQILNGDEETGAQGEMQKQAIMDLEMFMQTEMPDEYAEFEEGKNNKDYFIMEGF